MTGCDENGLGGRSVFPFLKSILRVCHGKRQPHAGGNPGISECDRRRCMRFFGSLGLECLLVRFYFQFWAGGQVTLETC